MKQGKEKITLQDLKNLILEVRDDLERIINANTGATLVNNKRIEELNNKITHIPKLIKESV